MTSLLPVGTSLGMVMSASPWYKNSFKSNKSRICQYFDFDCWFCFYSLAHSNRPTFSVHLACDHVHIVVQSDAPVIQQLKDGMRWDILSGTNVANSQKIIKYFSAGQIDLKFKLAQWIEIWKINQQWNMKMIFMGNTLTVAAAPSRRCICTWEH